MTVQKVMAKTFVPPKELCAADVDKMADERLKNEIQRFAAKNGLTLKPDTIRYEWDPGQVMYDGQRLRIITALAESEQVELP